MRRLRGHRAADVPRSIAPLPRSALGQPNFGHAQEPSRKKLARVVGPETSGLGAINDAYVNAAAGYVAGGSSRRMRGPLRPRRHGGRKPTPVAATSAQPTCAALYVISFDESGESRTLEAASKPCLAWPKVRQNPGNGAFCGIALITSTQSI